MSATTSRRRGLLDWKGVLGLVISAAALYFTFSRMELRSVMSELRAADPFLFILSAAAITGVFWIRAWRWKAILAPVADVSFRSRFSAVTIGFMGNNVLPARVGEFMRAYALSRTEPVPIVASFASLLIERIFDGIFVIALLFIAMAMPDFPPFSGSQAIDLPGVDATITIAGLAKSLGVIIIAALLVIGMLVAFPRRAVRTLESLVRVLPRKVRRPIVDALEAFLSGTGVLREPLLLLRIAAWSLFLWVYNAVGAWVAFRAFGFDLPFTAALFLQSAIALAVSIPSAPGFVGPYHGMVVFVLAKLWGAPAEQAGAFAIGFHLAGFIPVTVIGLYYAWRMGLSLGEVRESEEIVEEAVEQELDVEDRPDSSGPRPFPR
ncbi:MAG TPA: lysylphosphatidylglycerol synthase transmembrane domain-containing protein [Longimicrobiales bacterium]|nr:lysylphosphatidylglycerol synthase transmembrane domain-containing protein [Longimicrobiales bacterium]